MEDVALDEAARLSAGVPGSFVRLMFEAFDLAEARDLSKLDLATLTSAAAGQRREMLAATQNDEVRAALGWVRKTKTLPGTRAWQLLNALLIVETTSDDLGYDVNPLLQRDADAWKPQT